LDDAKAAANAAKESADAAKEAADAGKLQAETAQQTLQTMQDTAQRQLRAYVFAEPGDISFGAAIPGVPSQEWNYEIRFKNSGQTPAYEFTQSTRCAIAAEPVAETIFTVGRDGLSKAPLPSSQQVKTAGRIRVSISDASDIRAGIKTFFVYGEIRYVDGFGRNRLSKFRFMNNHTTGPHDLIYCGAGNEEITL
jgi:hypothetical protein